MFKRHVGVALIATAAMLLSATLHAQEGRPEELHLYRVRVGEANLSNAIGSQQPKKTLHKAIHKPVRKMRRITQMQKF
jgi:hypothetical protein